MKEQHVWLEQVELKNHLGFYGRVKIHVHLKNKEENKTDHFIKSGQSRIDELKKASSELEHLKQLQLTNERT